MRQIQLTQGYVAFVGDEDYAYLSQFMWYAEVYSSGVYAARRLPSPIRTKIFMHNVIMGVTPSKLVVVDHKNGDTLDNRRENLRVCTVSQNNMNACKRKTVSGRPTSSQYKGVSWHTRDLKWRADIHTQGRTLHLGSFENEEDAALAYNDAASQYFGEFARLNCIPNEGQSC